MASRGFRDERSELVAAEHVHARSRLELGDEAVDPRVLRALDPLRPADIRPPDERTLDEAGIGSGERRERVHPVGREEGSSVARELLHMGEGVRALGRDDLELEDARRVAASIGAATIRESAVANDVASAARPSRTSRSRPRAIAHAARAQSQDV